jgi:hypothetical protein
MQFSPCCDSSMKSANLLVFGNPLLDVTINIEDEDLLKKYNLDRNGQAEVPLEKLQLLFNDARARYVCIYMNNFYRSNKHEFTPLS